MKRAAKSRGEWKWAALKSRQPENLGFLNESVHWVDGNVWLAQRCEYANQMLFKLWYLSHGITSGANHIYKSLHMHPVIAALVSPVAFITNLTFVSLGRNNHQWITFTDSTYLCCHWQRIMGSLFGNIKSVHFCRGCQMPENHDTVIYSKKLFITRFNSNN